MSNDTEITKEELLDWWRCPAGLEMRRELRERIAQVSDEALTLPVVRDPIQGAIRLGQKQAFQEMLEWGEAREKE